MGQKRGAEKWDGYFSSQFYFSYQLEMSVRENSMKQ